MRAIRGATTIAEDTEAAIRGACCQLFGTIVQNNGLDNDDLISVIVTTTEDISSMFPAKAIREECDLGDVPLLGAVEARIDGGLPLAIRVLVHVNTTIPRSDINHVFLGGAAQLRPDIGTS